MSNDDEPDISYKILHSKDMKEISFEVISSRVLTAQELVEAYQDLLDDIIKTNMRCLKTFLWWKLWMLRLILVKFYISVEYVHETFSCVD